MTKVVMGDCHAAFVESHRAVGLTIEDIWKQSMVLKINSIKIQILKFWFLNKHYINIDSDEFLISNKYV